jgi:predicted dehydrogenase/aryl-alcohol dehydrogenase-like predicted oxidoreductase
MPETLAVGWGILGPGKIAKAFAEALATTTSGKLVAIASRNPAKPGLADTFPGVRIHDGYQALLDDPEVEAVYIATPHPQHVEWAVRAAEAGKHVLCEKPIAVSRPEAEAMFAAARKAGTFLGEAFMYRFTPLTERMIELVRTKAIGDLRRIRSSIGFAARSLDPASRLFANDAAGGAILDLGCYPASIARLLAGAADGKPYIEPSEVAGTGVLGATGVDEWAMALLTFPTGVIADLNCSIMIDQDNLLRVEGTTGWFEVKDFWYAAGAKSGVAEMTLHDRVGGGSQKIRVEEPRYLYSYEADAVAEAIRAGRTEFSPPGMTAADSLGNMRVLDRWRAAIGVEFDFEQPARRKNRIDGRPVKKSGPPIARRKIPGVAKEVSVASLGIAAVDSYTHAAALFDAYYERGGNLLDTAWLYAGGLTDKLLGEWLSARGVRDEMIIIGKGAHSPLCYPDIIARQLTESLDRLKTDRVEIYFMHRDNPAVPVGEFVDAMAVEAEAGRIGIFGGSNWTRERFDEAVAYATKQGKQAPQVLSNNFALAEMVSPVWPGVLASSDDAWKAWLNEKQVPNFAWSSQARGFFTDQAGRGKTDNPEIVRCWYSEKNFGRRDRAIELARRVGKSPINVALAYCLAQPFPVVPIIGPMGIGELEDSLEALTISLTPADVAWLENG